MSKLTNTANTTTAEIQNGLVVSRFGNQVEIMDEDGNVFRCHIRRSLQDIVSGDEVLWQEEFSSNKKVKGVVTEIIERHSVLKRLIRYEGLKPIAANLDRVFVVTAPEPSYSNLIIDRYLVAIELAGIELVILLNKSDRLGDYPELLPALKIYSDMGYQVIPVCAHDESGFGELREALASHTSVFVGQSGVGKSSLVNAIIPDVDTSVSELSENSGLGTHTTTVSKLYHLPSGGQLIDSPGIREFALVHIDKPELEHGFRDFAPYLGHCKFRNCRHIKEPGCAILAAVKEKDIHSLRLESYHLLFEETDEE
ncbi:MAG: small ribosomal subunit biogenesis GTPase RsgA [Gammaproteobacteria bacterium]|nr:small ribosomal subunit biogenesis GTPase RsgA [Gammaproteobacteria bacterium]